MCETGDVNIDNDLHKACISWISVQTVTVGAMMFVRAWNNHSIPGIFRLDLFLN